jgi:hypothetical protein
MATMPRALDRRLADLERLLPVGELEAELWRLPRWMDFHEIEVGQAAVARHRGDPVAALADPIFGALIMAARARRDGALVPALFGAG